MDENIVLDWTVAIEALDFNSVQELLDLQPELLWTPLTPSAHLETDFSHFVERLQEFKVLGTSIRPLYALHHILFDYGIEGDEWVEDRNELIDYILKKSTVEELDTCLWGEEQNTIMHLAHFLNRPELIQLLQDKGLDEKKTNKLGYLPIDNDQPKIIINKKDKGVANKPSATSDRFRRLRELAESPNNTKNKSKERQNSTRRYFRPGHLEELKRRVLSEEEEAELKEKQRQKRQKEVAQLTERSAVKNNPLFRKFESQQEESVKAKESIQTKAVDTAVKDKSKFLNAGEQVKRSSRVINILKDRSVVSTSVFRQQTETQLPKKVPSLRALKAGKELQKKKEEEEKAIALAAVGVENTCSDVDAEKPILEAHSPHSEVHIDSLSENEALVSPTVESKEAAPETALYQKNYSESSLGDNSSHSSSLNPNIETEVESLRLEEPQDKELSSPIKVPKFDLNLPPTDFQEKRQKAANGPNSDKFMLASGRKITIVKKSGNVKKIVNVHENLKEEEKVENYSTGKIFQVWKKDGETLEIAADEYDPEVHIKVLKSDDTLISNEHHSDNYTHNSNSPPVISNQKTSGSKYDPKDMIKNDLMERFKTMEDEESFSEPISSYKNGSTVKSSTMHPNSEVLDQHKKKEPYESSIPSKESPKGDLDTISTLQKVVPEDRHFENQPRRDKPENALSGNLEGVTKAAFLDRASTNEGIEPDIQVTGSRDLSHGEKQDRTNADSKDYTSSSELSTRNADSSNSDTQKESLEGIQSYDCRSEDSQLKLKSDNHYEARLSGSVLRNSLDSVFTIDYPSTIPGDAKNTAKPTEPTPSANLPAIEKQEESKVHLIDNETEKAFVKNTAFQTNALSKDIPQKNDEPQTLFDTNTEDSYIDYSSYGDFILGNDADEKDKSHFFDHSILQNNKEFNQKQLDDLKDVHAESNSQQKSPKSIVENNQESHDETSFLKNTKAYQESQIEDCSAESDKSNQNTNTGAFAIHTPTTGNKNDEYLYNDSQSISSFYSVDNGEQNYPNGHTYNNTNGMSKHQNASDTKIAPNGLHGSFDKNDTTEYESFSIPEAHSNNKMLDNSSLNASHSNGKSTREVQGMVAGVHGSNTRHQQSVDDYDYDKVYENNNIGANSGQKAKMERAHITPNFLTVENIQNERSVTQQQVGYKNNVQLNDITPNQGAMYIEVQRSHIETTKPLGNTSTDQGYQDSNKPIPIITNQGGMFASDDEDTVSTPTKENPYGQRDLSESKDMTCEQFMSVGRGSEYKGYGGTEENAQSSKKTPEASRLSDTATLHSLSLGNEANMFTITDTKGEKATVPDFLSKPYQSNKEFAPPNEKRKSGSQRNHWSVGINLVEKAPVRDSMATESETGNEQWFDPENEWVEEKAYSSHSSMTSDSFKNSSATGNTTMDEDEDVASSARKDNQGVTKEKQPDTEFDYYSSSPYQNKTKSYTSSNNEEAEGEILIFMQHEDQDHIQTKLEQKNNTTTTIVDREKLQLEETTEVTDQSRVEDITHYMRALPGTQGALMNDDKKQSIQAIGTEKINIPNAHELSEHVVLVEEIKQSKHGKIYIGVSGAHDVLLPLPKEITYARCVISDGEYEYMSRYEMLGEQILMDYECIIDAKPEMIITVSLHVRPDYHVKPRSGWTKWFTSIRKQKEHLSGYVHPEDGAIGQTRFAVDHMVPACFKKTYTANFDCFNSWYTRSSRERARREQFGDEEDFLKIVSKLNIEMLYLPVSSPSVQVPKSLRECDLTLKICQWHETCWQSGFLSTRIQGQKIWQRHYYRLIGSQLIGYVSDEEGSEVWNHFNIADVIRLSAAADKVIVNLAEQKTKDEKVFGAESIVEGNLKGFFRLTFPDYHLDCVSDEVSESEEWVKTLKSMIGRVPLRLPFTEYY
ncbi:hypothetical protein BY458DRAFT_588506 [Sporodiniella umbellata]|nr:hypothetical protein BY458DRAFT_588506 [Sporodiniella umbellata]